MPKPRALDWFALACAGLHPVQVAILETIAENGNESMSPAELAEHPRVLQAMGPGVKSQLGTTSYHVRELRDTRDLLEMTRTEPRRGALQHFYRIKDHGLLTPRQSGARALQRSMSRMAGAPVALTPDTMADALMRALGVSEGERKPLTKVCEDMLRGVAGA